MTKPSKAIMLKSTSYFVKKTLLYVLKLETFQSMYQLHVLLDHPGIIM